MLTDAPPRKANGSEFLQSDRIRTLDLPRDGVLLAVANSIDSAMKSGPTAHVRRACAEFLDTASDIYKVPTCCSQPGRYEFAKTGHADPDIHADNSAEGDHLFRHIPEHSLPRVLPSSRLSKMQISAFTSEL